MAQPLGSSIETQIVDGPNLISQVQENQSILQTVVQDVPQVQTVMTDNVSNISSIINAPFVEVTSVNGMTGDVITEPIMQNYQNNHYYPQNTIVNYNGVIYWAKNTFTSGNSFDSTKWNTVSVSAYKNLSGQLQSDSYRRSVIALCEVSTTNNTNKNSYSSGRLTFHRDNGYTGMSELDFNVENQYSKAYYFNASYYSNLKYLPATGVNLNQDEGFRFCSFKYNNVWYGGVEIFMGNAVSQYIAFEGIGNFTPFGLDYYKTSGSGTAEVLNQEVYNSLNYAQFDWNKAVIGARSLNTDTGWIKKNNTYTATLPDKDGTIAMTSDIPAAVKAEENAPEPEETAYDPGIEQKDYAGRTFTIMDRSPDSSGWWISMDVYSKFFKNGKCTLIADITVKLKFFHYRFAKELSVYILHDHETGLRSLLVIQNLAIYTHGSH